MDNLAEKFLNTKPKLFQDKLKTAADKLASGVTQKASEITKGVSQKANYLAKGLIPQKMPETIKEKQPFKYQPNVANTRGLIGQFVQHAANIGFARTNRFITFIYGPNIKAEFYKNPQGRSNAVNFGKQGSRQYINTEHQRRLALTCQDASLAGKALMTEDYNNTGNGPNTIHAYGENYSGDLSLSFLNSNDFFERMYFQNWMDKIVNPGNHEVALYDDYAKPWSIIVACLPANLYDPTTMENGQYGSGATLEWIARNSVTDKTSDIYFVRYDHVYPYRINDQTMSSGGSTDFLKFTVQFRYHRWYDPVVRYMQDQEYKRNDLVGLKTEIAARYENYYRRQEQEKQIRANYVPVRNLVGPNYRHIPDPVDQVGESEEELSPFDKFKKLVKNIAKYSNPKELKGLVINQGVEYLGGVIGEGTVESIAEGGQIVDVYLKSPDKGYQATTSKLIGPLGEML